MFKMARKIYLEGGGDIRKGENDHLDRKALNESKNKKVYILDLTSNDREKVAQYRLSLEEYFRRLGAKKVDFVSTSQSLNEIEEKLMSAGVVYIPGGDTEVLINNLKHRKISSLLINLESIFVGNSAGAMVLCNEAICAYEKRGIIDGLGLVGIAIDVHYDKTHDKKLNELSKKREMYAIPEGSAIIFKNGKLSFIGNIYKFSNKKKIKIN